MRSLLRRTGVVRAGRNLELVVLDRAARLSRSTRRRGSSGDHGLSFVACTPTYLPDHRRGAEVTLHAVLVELAKRGHRARVLVDAVGSSGVVDGIEVIATSDRRTRARLARESDVIFGQLASRWTSLALAARWQKPSVYFVHVGNVSRRSLYGRPDLTVFSSRVVQSQYPWIENGMVLHPPVSEQNYRVTPGDAITLVNLTPAKGVSLFYELAERLPERSFLAVRGWGPQVVRDPMPENVVVTGPVADMRSVYCRTRLLVMPSAYESYGRVAVEGAASGIPTIAAPCEGLREAMGDAAVWVDGSDLDGWIDAIRLLDDEARYDRWQETARAHFESLAPQSEIEVDAFERAVLELTRRAPI